MSALVLLSGDVTDDSNAVTVRQFWLSLPGNPADVAMAVMISNGEHVIILFWIFHPSRTDWMIWCHCMEMS